MKIKTEEFQKACNAILTATTGSQAIVSSNELEMITTGNELRLKVANAEYNVEVKFPLTSPETFHATVSAELFLKLVAQITTDEIEMLCGENSLLVKANGKYTLPMIYHGDKLLQTQQIEIHNITTQMNISGEILASILNYNSKELQQGIITNPLVQKYYYLDEEGCITYTSGACVNSFSLEKPIKLLLNTKIVKFFKLFKNEDIHFTLGYDTLPNSSMLQTKIKFESATVTLTAIVASDDNALNSIPAKAIRSAVDTVLPYTVSLNKSELLQTLKRLLLFNASVIQYQIENVGTFEFTPEKLIVWDAHKHNSEELNYSFSGLNGQHYSMLVNLEDLKASAEMLPGINLTLSFGDGHAVVLKRENITLFIPECIMGVEDGGE